jgi:hypothetical protein
MPIGKLKALNVTRMKRPGMYGDGGGLWLRISSAGAKVTSWGLSVCWFDRVIGDVHSLIYAMLKPYIYGSA